MNKSIPGSTAILLVATVFTAFYLVAHEIPFYLWFFLLSVIGFFAYKANQANDEPPPVVYPFHAVGIWGMMDSYLRDNHNETKNVVLNVEQSVAEPNPGEPLYVKAAISVHHADLRDMIKVVRYLRPEFEDLRSKIIMRAYITSNKDGTTTVKYVWEVHPIFHRIDENNIIRDLSLRLDEALTKGIEKAKNAS